MDSLEKEVGYIGYAKNVVVSCITLMAARSALERFGYGAEGGFNFQWKLALLASAVQTAHLLFIDPLLSSQETTISNVFAKNVVSGIASAACITTAIKSSFFDGHSTDVLMERTKMALLPTAVCLVATDTASAFNLYMNDQVVAPMNIETMMIKYAGGIAKHIGQFATVLLLQNSPAASAAFMIGFVGHGFRQSFYESMSNDDEALRNMNIINESMAGGISMLFLNLVHFNPNYEIPRIFISLTIAETLENMVRSADDYQQAYDIANPL